METPPTYAPPKKSNTGLIIGLVLGGIAICCIGGVALMFFGGLAIFKGVAPMAECAMNYTFVEQALSAYEREHDGKLPSAAKWQDELAPYVAKETTGEKQDGNPFKIMDAKGDWGCTAGDTKTGMAFNTEMDGKKMEDARSKNTVIIFESPKTGRNLALKYEMLDRASSPKLMGNPRGWITIQGGSGVVMDNKRMGSKFDMN
ncbi:MAG: hypothetical protein H7Y17_15655 [Chlorobia bacterium]|nr:hypothetical protein [Fimbriimonadaceae bacterium]